MSDEQKMPDVTTRKWYPTLATRMAGSSSVAAMVDCEQRYNQDAYVTYADHLATIATLTAERDARDKQVRELVEALEDMEDQSITVDEEGEDRCTQCGWYAYIHEPACVFALAAQLKEQDDD